MTPNSRRFGDRVSELAAAGVGAVDRWQQRHRAPAFLVAVMRKAGEDKVADLSAVVAFYAFFSIFPLLVVLATVTGFVLQGDPALRARLLDQAVEQFPDSPGLRDAIDSLEGSGVLLVVGVLGALWSGFGVVHALRNAFERVWAVPRRDRAGFVKAQVMALAVLVSVGVGLAGSVALGQLGRLLPETPVVVDALGVAGSFLVVGGVFLLVFRILSPADQSWRVLVPGVVVAALGWAVLQHVGSALIARQVGNRNVATGVFTSALVLLTWMALQARLTIMGAEVAAVRALGWWPRALRVDEPAEADHRTLRAHARTEERIEGERIEVTFVDPATDEPRTDEAGPDA
jgi:YihY family inner membrane protein